jgi:hypothetical protein
LCNRVKDLIFNDLVCEIHLAKVKEVNEENASLEKMGEFWLCGIKSFHEMFPILLKSTNSTFHLDFKPYMHFVVSMDGTMVYIQWWISPPHPPHDEHFFPLITLDPLKDDKNNHPHMGEVLTPLSIDGQMEKNAYITIRPK